MGFTIWRYRLRLSKLGDLRFIGHLDFAREFERALRRAGVVMAYTQGFNPRPRISFALALALGSESEAEYADVYTARNYEPRVLVGKVNTCLVSGMAVTAIRRVPVDGPEPATAVRAASYEVIPCISAGGCDRNRAGSILRSFSQLESMPWRRAGKKGVRETDIRREILGLCIEDEEYLRLRLVLRAGTAGAVRPDEVLRAFNSFAGFELFRPEESLVRRTEMYFIKGGKLEPLFEV